MYVELYYKNTKTGKDCYLIHELENITGYASYESSGIDRMTGEVKFAVEEEESFDIVLSLRQGHNMIVASVPKSEADFLTRQISDYMKSKHS